MPAYRQRLPFKWRNVQKILRANQLGLDVYLEFIDIAEEEALHSGALLTVSRQAYGLDIPQMAAAYGVDPGTWSHWESQPTLFHAELVDALLATHPWPWVTPELRPQWNQACRELVEYLPPHDPAVIDLATFIPHESHRPADDPIERMININSFLPESWGDDAWLFDPAVLEVFMRVTRTALGMPTLSCDTPNTGLWLVWMVATASHLLALPMPYINTLEALLVDLHRLSDPLAPSGEDIAAARPFNEWHTVLKGMVRLAASPV